MHEELTIGHILQGRYTIERLMKKGDFTYVYKAKDQVVGGESRSVALKEASFLEGDLPLIMRRVNFERQGDVLSTISHPSIPKALDMFHQGNRSYLVLEFVDGVDLETLVDETDESLSEDRLIELSSNICESLSYMHTYMKYPLVHRDIKPSHVLIDHGGNSYVVGFACAASPPPGMLLPFPKPSNFSAPEVNDGIVDQRSDLFGLGATIFYGLTGSTLLERSFGFIREAILDVNTDISTELCSLIEVALQPNMEDRFRSAEDMKRALQEIGRNR